MAKRKNVINSQIGATDLIEIFDKELNGVYFASDFTREIVFISFVCLSSKLDRAKIKLINFPSDEKYDELLKCNNSLEILLDMQKHFIDNNEHYRIFFKDFEFVRYAQINYDDIFKNIFKLLEKHNVETILRKGFFSELYQNLMTYGTQKSFNAFYTPMYVSVLMSKIMGFDDPKPKKRFNDIVDTCCGSGNLLLASLVEELENNKQSFNTYWCNDLDFKALNTCVFNLILNGAKGVFWRYGNGLDDYTKLDFKGLVYYTEQELKAKMIEELMQQKAI